MRVGALTNKAAHYRFELVRIVGCALFGLTSILKATIGDICRERRGAGVGGRRGVRKLIAAAHYADKHGGRRAHENVDAAQENACCAQKPRNKRRIQASKYLVLGRRPGATAVADGGLDRATVASMIDNPWRKNKAGSPLGKSRHFVVALVPRRRLVAASATATAAAAVTTAAATAAARVVFPGLGFVHGERTTIVFLVVQAVDCGLCFRIGRHFDEAEAFAAARVTILDDLSAGHLAEGAEHRFEIGAARAIRQISYVQPLTHTNSPANKHCLGPTERTIEPS